MYQKDKSLQKKEGWARYKQRSWVLLPKLYSSDTVSIAAYGTLGAFLLYDYS
jgi:hypothetical protein